MAARPPAATLLVAGALARVAPLLRTGALGRTPLIGRCDPTRPPFLLVALWAYPLPYAFALSWRNSHSARDPPAVRSPFQPCTLSPSCFASPAFSRLRPLARCRRFSSNAPALPAYVVLGSPAQAACAGGSSLPTTARPPFRVTLPATDDGREWARYARGRCPQRLPPPPLRALLCLGLMISRKCSVFPLLPPTANPALQRERHQYQQYQNQVTHIFS